MYCRSCGWRVSNEEGLCRDCSKAKQVSCQNCRSRMSSSDVYCTWCGSRQLSWWDIPGRCLGPVVAVMLVEAVFVTVFTIWLMKL